MNKTLNRLEVGECAIILNINAKGSMYRRLLDLGLVAGTLVRCIMKAPSGDPSAYLIRGAVIALRDEDSAKIEVKASNFLCGVGDKWVLQRSR